MPAQFAARAAAETTLEDFSAVLDVNLTGLWALSQAAGRVMLAQGSGKIINIASVLTLPGRRARAGLHGIQACGGGPDQSAGE